MTHSGTTMRLKRSQTPMGQIVCLLLCHFLSTASILAGRCKLGSGLGVPDLDKLDIPPLHFAEMWYSHFLVAVL